MTADAGGIGYVGFASKRGAKSVDLVSTCGIPISATAFSAKTEEYPLQRRLRLFVDNSPLTAHERGLLEFAISEDAQGLVRKAGFIDLGVTADDSAIDPGKLLSTASEDLEPAAIPVLQRMLGDLTGAERLSTTFRFTTGSVRLDNKAVRDLGRMARFLSRPENAGREIFVVGYTDSVGPFPSNERLAQGRAAVVLDALLRHPDARGLRDLRISSTGYGELSPVGCNDSDLGRARNRRVEIWIR